MTRRRVLGHSRGGGGEFTHEGVWIFLDPSEKGNLGTDTLFKGLPTAQNRVRGSSRSSWEEMCRDPRTQGGSQTPGEGQDSPTSTCPLQSCHYRRSVGRMLTQSGTRLRDGAGSHPWGQCGKPGKTVPMTVALDILSAFLQRLSRRNELINF